MNYDEDELGVGNSQHPANQEPEEEEYFESDDLQECLDYFRATNDIDHLENAIALNELKKQMVKEDLTEAIKLLRIIGKDATANFLCLTRDKLR